VTAAVFDDGVEDGAAFTGGCFAYEQEVLFPDCCRPDRIFYVEIAIMRMSVREIALIKGTLGRMSAESTLEAGRNLGATYRLSRSFNNHRPMLMICAMILTVAVVIED
jgi:hypothetical protein